MKSPDFWYKPNNFYSSLLSPFGQIYRAAGIVRRAIATPYKSSVPVICVGNIVAGGAGKTPTALAIAEILKQKGAIPVFVTRGYGGTEKGVLKVDISKHTASEVGDEALLLAKAAPCWIGRDRAAAVREAEKHATHIILDDGLQNPTVAHTASLLVIDGAVGLGNGQLIPAGPLRETLADALPRVNTVVIIGEDKHNISSCVIPAKAGIQTRRVCGAKSIMARRRSLMDSRFRGNDGDSVIRKFPQILHAKIQTLLPENFSLNRPYFAFAGIGRPEKFYTSCREAGINLLGTKDFPDHHKYTAEELLQLSGQAKTLGAQLITTEKDWVRLPEHLRQQVSVLPIELVFGDVKLCPIKQGNS